jgi:hypothetical protein
MIILLCGLMDYVRGRGWTFLPYLKQLAIVTNGYLLAVLSGHALDYYTIVYIVLFWGGISIGYGNPWGAAIHGRTPREQYNHYLALYLSGGYDHKPKFEWWQTLKITRNNTYAALLVRGLLFAPFLIIGAWPVLTAYAIAFPLAGYVSYRISEWQNKPDKRFEYGEFVRGEIAGGVVYVFGI